MGETDAASARLVTNFLQGCNVGLNLPPEELAEDGLPIREPLRICGISGPSWDEFANGSHSAGTSCDFTFLLTRSVTKFEKAVAKPSDDWNDFRLRDDHFVLFAGTIWIRRRLTMLQEFVQEVEANGRARELQVLRRFEQMEAQVRRLDASLSSHLPEG